MFDNIKKGPLQVPQGMPSDALDLIVKLLNRDPKHRLGSGPGDAEELKQHPFFADINWDEAKLRKLKVPKPICRSIVSDGCNFDAFQDCGSPSDDNRLNKWTFVSSEFGGV